MGECDLIRKFSVRCTETFTLITRIYDEHFYSNVESTWHILQSNRIGNTINPDVYGIYWEKFLYLAYPLAQTI